MSKLQISIFSGISILLIVIGKIMENNYSLKSGVAILAIMSFITGYNMVFQNRIDLFAGSSLKKEDLDNLSVSEEVKIKYRPVTLSCGLFSFVVGIYLISTIFIK